MKERLREKGVERMKNTRSERETVKDKGRETERERWGVVVRERLDRAADQSCAAAEGVCCGVPL